MACLSHKESELTVPVFTDASLDNINSGTGSTGAYIICPADNTGLCCPIAWHASKIREVVRSAIPAEAMSLQEGLEAGLYYRHMIEEILGVTSKTIPVAAYTDNRSVTEAVYLQIWWTI